jgi:hypothetical protein
VPKAGRCSTARSRRTTRQLKSVDRGFLKVPAFLVLLIVLVRSHVTPVASTTGSAAPLGRLALSRSRCSGATRESSPTSTRGARRAAAWSGRPGVTPTPARLTDDSRRISSGRTSTRCPRRRALARRGLRLPPADRRGRASIGGRRVPLLPAPAPAGAADRVALTDLAVLRTTAWGPASLAPLLTVVSVTAVSSGIVAMAALPDGHHSTVRHRLPTAAYASVRRWSYALVNRVLLGAALLIVNHAPLLGWPWRQAARCLSSGATAAPCSPRHPAGVL